MKNKFRHRFCIALCALLIGAGTLYGCGANSDTNTDTADMETAETTPAIETEPPIVDAEGLITLVENGESRFQIIRSDLSGTGIIGACKLIKNVIEEKTGATLKLATDWDDDDISNFEIVVGDTTRAESQEAMESLSNLGYYIGVSTTEESARILILGANDMRTEYAVERFVSTYLTPDADGKITIPAEFIETDKLMVGVGGEKGYKKISELRGKTFSSRQAGHEGYALKSITGIRMITALTGEYSINNTRTNYSIGGTDLGVMVEHKGKMYFFFGDTRGGEQQDGDWWCNTCAITSDFDYRDGILFDTMVLESENRVKELIAAKRIDYNEVTKIPTGAISIGDNLYLSFMSVNNWNGPTGWDCNYGGVAKSTDDGQTWEILTDLRWKGTSAFCQMHPVYNEKDGMIYVYGITGGRRGGARLMRVAPEDYENFDAYEYLVGRNEDGTPIFEKGEEAMMSKFAAVNGQNGELSVMYSEYLGEWIVMRMTNWLDITLCTAKEPWGPFSPNTTVLYQSDVPGFTNQPAGLYGGFMHPAYTSEDGRKIGFILSLWLPTYNTVVMEMTLNK